MTRRRSLCWIQFLSWTQMSIQLIATAGQLFTTVHTTVIFKQLKCWPTLVLTSMLFRISSRRRFTSQPWIITSLSLASFFSVMQAWSLRMNLSVLLSTLHAEREVIRVSSCSWGKELASWPRTTEAGHLYIMLHIMGRARPSISFWNGKLILINLGLLGTRKIEQLLLLARISMSKRHLIVSTNFHF